MAARTRATSILATGENTLRSSNARSFLLSTVFRIDVKRLLSVAANTGPVRNIIADGAACCDNGETGAQ